MDKYRHSLARANRITSSRIGTIATGNYQAWNTLADKIRNAKPAPIRSRRESGVASLDWGHRHEPQAKALFWKLHPEYELEDEHWCYWHDPRAKVLYELCGTSPDATLYQKARRVSGLEVKCPYDPAIYRRYRLEDRCPPEYQAQVHWHMIVTDTPYWWFVSFDPREVEPLMYVERRIERDYAYEAELMEKVNRFIGGYLAGEHFKPKTHTAADYAALFGEPK